ncbi:MAG: hypothetical protein IJ272_07645 [Clostridia bacterium]|nr:hypothetical protein [Clostridia bacterium]
MLAIERRNAILAKLQEEKKVVVSDLSILYNVPCIAVDTHVSRVSVRLGLAKKGDDVLTIERKLNRKLDRSRLNRLHHQFVLFGRYYCTARNPKCISCPLKNMCKEKHDY